MDCLKLVLESSKPVTRIACVDKGTSTPLGIYNPVTRVGSAPQNLDEQPMVARIDNFVVKHMSGVTITTPAQNAVLPTELTGQAEGGIRLER
jgi:hypothetical protein